MTESQFLRRVGANIKRRREAIGMDQRTLAQVLGVVPAAVCHWEKGNNGMVVTVLLRMAALFDCKPSELLP